MKIPTIFLATMLVCAHLVPGQTDVRPSADVTVTIIPEKPTVFAGETLTFTATIFGIDDKGVNWAVNDEDGGIITSIGQYTAPKIQGVYHITAASRTRPDVKTVTTVTVLTYCDPLPNYSKPQH